MTMERGAGMSPGSAVPSGGVFAISEVLPLQAQASRVLNERRQTWRELRDAAAEAKALAKKTRADLVVYLRVWGVEATGGVPMKTSVERQEWADASEEVQQAELEADLAQSAAMDARAALDHAEEYFKSLTTMLGIERDTFKAERHGG